MSKIPFYSFNVRNNNRNDNIYNIACHITQHIYIDSIKFIECKTLNLKTTRLNHMMDFGSIQTTNATTNSILAQLALDHKDRKSVV